MLLLSLGVLLTIVLVTLVLDRQPTIYPYLAVAIALAAVVVFSMIGYYRGQVGRFTTIFLVLILYVLFVNIQFIATRYSVMMPDDVVQEYAVLNTFSQAGRLFVIPHAEFSVMLNWYSSWPVIHSLSLIFGDVLGIELAKLPVVLPTILGVIGFVFVYLLADKLAQGLKLNRLVVPIALLLYAISPEAIYFGMKFVQQGMGLMLVLVQFYLIYKYIVEPDARILALAALNAVLLVATHHYTSFVFVTYLLAFALVTLVLVLARRIVEAGWLASLVKIRRQAVVLGLMALVISGAILAWWSIVGTTLMEGPVIWAMGRIREVLERVSGMVVPAAVGASTLPTAGSLAEAAEARASISLTPFFPQYLYPPELTPPWVALLWLRDFLLYAPVVFGFAWLFRQKLRTKPRDLREFSSFYLLVLSLSFFGVLFLFELFISRVEPYRVVLLGLPFVALGSAILYGQVLTRRKWLQCAGCGLIVLAVTMSFLGLWGHRHAPVNLYSSAISHHDVGEPTPLDERHYALQAFVDGNHLDDGATAIVSDDNGLLYLLLSPEHYHKFGLTSDQLVSGLKKEINTPGSLVVVDFGTSLYSYYTIVSGRIGPEGAQQYREQYRAVLEGGLNKVYDNTFEVWLEVSKGHGKADQLQVGHVHVVGS